MASLDSWQLQSFKHILDSPQKDKNQMFICELKQGALTKTSIANPNFFEIVLSVGYLHEVGSLEFSFQAIDELVCSTCYL